MFTRTIVAIIMLLSASTFCGCASSVMQGIEPSEVPFRFALISESDVCVNFYIRDYEESVRIRHAIDELREQNRDYWDGELSDGRCLVKSVQKYCRIEMHGGDRADAFAMTNVGSHILDSGIFRRRLEFEIIPNAEMVIYEDKGAKVFSGDIFGYARPLLSSCKSPGNPERVSSIQCQDVVNLDQMVSGMPIHQWVDPALDISQRYILRWSVDITPGDYPADLVAKQLPPVRVLTDVFVDISGKIIDVRSRRICGKDGKHTPYSGRFLSLARSLILNRARILSDLYRLNGKPVPFVWSTSITFIAPELKEK